MSKEIVKEQNVPPVFLDHEQLNIRMESTTPLDFFELYFTEDVVRLLVIETNRYAANFFAENLEASEKSYTDSWQDVDEVEMRTFIGLIFVMGIIYKLSIPMYWFTDELYHIPIFQKAMSHNRFQLILKFFHCNDNNNPQHDANDENRNRLYKVRPLIELLRARCKTVYTPGQDVSVDESLVLFKGRLKFKQFIKTKRAGFGIKLFELATSDGITLEFLIYRGHGMFDDDDENEEMPVTERIPVALMQPYLDSGRVLFADNFYTSPSLAKYLKDHNTFLCGTIKTKRTFHFSELVDVHG